VYSKVMVPVDLAHVDRLTKAIDLATDFAKRYAIPVCFVGITPSTPTPVAHTPKEFARSLEDFAQAQGDKHGLTATSAAYISDDPAVDLSSRPITRSVRTTFRARSARSASTSTTRCS
jgi:hypothetical protein